MSNSINVSARPRFGLKMDGSFMPDKITLELLPLVVHQTVLDPLYRFKNFATASVRVRTWSFS